MFMLTKAVPIYVSDQLISAAWGVVPKSVRLNGWLKTDILTLYQRGEVREI